MGQVYLFYFVFPILPSKYEVTIMLSNYELNKTIAVVISTLYLYKDLS